MSIWIPSFNANISVLFFCLDQCHKCDILFYLVLYIFFSKQTTHITDLSSQVKSIKILSYFPTTIFAELVVEGSNQTEPAACMFACPDQHQAVALAPRSGSAPRRPVRPALTRTRPSMPCGAVPCDRERTGRRLAFLPVEKAPLRPWLGLFLFLSSGFGLFLAQLTQKRCHAASSVQSH